jgi:predicted ATPase/class 3 adenylate cyclase
VAALRAFLMTDLVGSTRAMLADEDAMRSLIDGHDAALADAISRAHGRIFKHTGDGICAVFDEPLDAVEAAVDAQCALARLNAAVRMGVDVGPVAARGDDFFGITLNRCSRLMALAHGGQILTTMAVEELVRRALPVELELVDRGLVRLRDFDADERVFQVVAPQLRRDFPALPGALDRPFPSPRTPLFGRNVELRALHAAVGPGRLANLVGPGGSGKTRLALETLRDRHVELGGGIFVDLAPLTDASLVPLAVAEALAMPAGTAAPFDDVLAFLAARRLLLVLDNCEHVGGGAADLCDAMLTRCPGVAQLATSREPLRVPGEQIIRLGPLPIGDAADLFMERAERVGATDISERDRAVVETLCAHLDGIPLAVELAAAHAAHLPLADLGALVEHNVGALVDERRGTAIRHRTLEAALAWSYDLLPPSRQRLLRQLAAFTGEFTLRGVECVAELDAVTAAREIGALVDASLVVLRGSSSSYRLLETVRAFAGARLAEAGEMDEVFDRLRRHILRGAPGPWTCWLNQLPPSDISFGVANLRGVLSWCAARGRPDQAAALVAADLSPWFMTSRAAEGSRWLNAGLQEARSTDDHLAFTTAATWLAFTTFDRRLSEIDDVLRITPEDHPAQLPLRFLAAWRIIRGDYSRLRDVLDTVRSHPDATERWQQLCDLLDAIGLLLAGRPADAVDVLSWVTTVSIETRNFVATVILAEHLAGLHADASRLMHLLNELPPAPTTTFSDLIRGLAAVAEAVGRTDQSDARQALQQLLETIDREYPHLRTTYGFGLQAAAVVAHITDRPEDVITLLAGSERHGLHYRYEGAEALGRAYGERAAARLGPETTAAARERGRAMSIDALVALARSVADDSHRRETNPQ